MSRIIWINLCVLSFLGCVLFGADPGYTIKEDAPADIRAYLEEGLQNGKKRHNQRIESAKKQVNAAQERVDNARKLYRKKQASKEDVKSAETQLADAKTEQTKAQQAPPVALASLARFDQPGKLGTLTHGMGISRVVDGENAIVYPFVEKAGKSDDKLFTNAQELNKQIAPAERAVLLAGVSTADFQQGQRIEADDKVYRVEEMQTIDDQKLYVLRPVDVQQYLVAIKR